MSRNTFKKIAEETLVILNNGYYFYNNHEINIDELHKKSVEHSFLIAPVDWSRLPIPAPIKNNTTFSVLNAATTEALLQCVSNGYEDIGILNFASAKNPGGGFLNGSMAQEESLALSSGLYDTQLKNKRFYEQNRKCKSMCYTDYAIYSPDVVFFRDAKFHLLQTPVTASTLTIPAVNMKQVIAKKEDVKKSKEQMYNRMKLALLGLASQGNKTIILGAFGCGVFGNDPKEVANWWKMLLENEFKNVFEHVIFAVLDKHPDSNTIKPFKNLF